MALEWPVQLQQLLTRSLKISLIGVLAVGCGIRSQHELFIYDQTFADDKEAVNNFMFCYAKDDTFFHVFPHQNYVNSIVEYDTIVDDNFDTLVRIKDSYQLLLPAINSYGPYWVTKKGKRFTVRTNDVTETTKVVEADYWVGKKKTIYDFPELHQSSIFHDFRSSLQCSYTGRDSIIMMDGQRMKVQIYYQSSDVNFLDGHDPHRMQVCYVDKKSGQVVRQVSYQFDNNARAYVQSVVQLSQVINCEEQNCDSLLNLLPTLGQNGYKLPWNGNGPEQLRLSN